MQQIKGLIRRGEARAAGRDCGVPKMDNLHFLDMPFYETGKVRKKPLGEQDIKSSPISWKRSSRTRSTPPAISPTRTARTASVSPPFWPASTASKIALVRRHAKSGSTAAPGRNGNREQIEMAVPLSPQELLRKRSADLQAPEPKGQGDVPRHPTSANSGSAPKTATAPPLTSTTSSVWRSTKPSKVSSAGPRSNPSFFLEVAPMSFYDNG